METLARQNWRSRSSPLGGRGWLVSPRGVGECADVLNSGFRRRLPAYFEVQSFWNSGETLMKLKVIVHPADEGGYWAEVPAIPGCATQGETMDELLDNLHEAIEGCLSVDAQPAQEIQNSRVLEITV